MDKLHFDVPAFRAFHRFGDLYATAIASIDSRRVKVELLRDAKDCIGPHWYGMRVRVTSLRSGMSNYLHTGLIFLPTTKIGLMVEVDEKNNLGNYKTLTEGLHTTEDFVVSQEEKEYLKLFMPENDFLAMNQADADTQIQMLSRYFRACAEAIEEVGQTAPFRISCESMANAFTLGRAFRQVITTARDPAFTAEINERDPDNFGQYAMGYRYHLRNAQGSARMYAYFGAIHSYKKDPAGIFGEIDEFSNPEVFAKVKANFKATPAFEYSAAEEKFIKLFMPQATLDAFNAAEPGEQMEILEKFFCDCSRALALASE